jgi:hypothetical protein
MSEWIKISEQQPSDAREVFAWCKECGIFYCARWQDGSFNLPWEPTHWMDRPKNPED